MAFIQSPSIVTANLTLLVDPANLKSYDSRENLLQYSSQIHTSPWGLGNILNSGADSTAAPDGTLTADKLIENTSAGVYHYHSQSLTKPAEANTYTYSVYAKDAGRAVMGLRVESSGNGAVYAVDLSNGTVQLAAGTYGTSFSNPVGSVTSVGNGWYRMSLTVTTDAATSIFVQNYLYSKTAGSSVYTGDGVSGVYVWGAQLERATTPQTYTPTTASAITRSTTTNSVGSSYTGTLTNGPVFDSNNNGSFYFNRANASVVTNATLQNIVTTTAGTISVWCKPMGATSPTVSNSYDGQIILSDEGAGGWSYVDISRATIGGLDRIWVGNYTTGNDRVAIPFTVGQWINIVWVHAAGTLYGYANGNLVSSVTSGNTANIGTAIMIGSLQVHGASFVGYISNVLSYNVALSAAEIKQNFNALRGRYGI